MPRRTRYALVWRPDARRYELQDGAAPLAPAIVPDTPAWFDWLEGAGSFAFHSASGVACTLRKETVQRGGTYWYAYWRAQGRVAKRYVGRSADLTLRRLEGALAEVSTPVPVRSTTARSMADQTPARLLLATKLSAPRTAAHLLDRPHVLQRLQRGLKRPLTLIAAPAGFGKTTALRAWAQLQALPHDASPEAPPDAMPDEPTPVAWVSLDVGDNDAVQFWTYVCAALDRAHPGAAATALSMLQARRPPPFPVVVHGLLNALAALTRDVALVLDDFHLITTPAIHEAVASLLEHPPAQLHLYLATRTIPPLPLARLRAYDRVNEIRADDLRLRPDETAAFLAEVMRVELPVEDVLRLAERTDGWIAGLQLAGLSLQGHPDPSRFVATFGGSHRHVLTYLGEEVFAAQPTEVQSFLLETALLERMCAPLCDAVTGRQDGQAMLERLERANLFLTPLDDEGRWYRYHHLFAELLRHRLRQERPPEEGSARIAELHRRAARWLEGVGWIVEAAEHLLAAKDADAAAALIERAAREWLKRGDATTLLRLMERLPETVLAARPHLCLYQVSAFFFVGRLEEAEQRITYVERHLLPSLVEQRDEWHGVVGEVAACRATLAVMRGDASGAIAHAHVAIANLPEDEAAFRGGIGLPLGIAYMVNGQMRAAEAALAEASRVSLASGNVATASIALNMRALVLTQQGRLRAAADLYRQVIAMAEARGGASLALAGAAYTGLGELLYNENDLVAAKLALEKAIALGQQWANGQDEVDGYVRLAALYQAQGQAIEAREAQRQADELIERLGQARIAWPWVTPYVAAMGARLALRQGRLEAARGWAERRSLAVGRYAVRHANDAQEFESLTFSRLLLAQGQSDDAARLLDPLLEAARAEERSGAVIEIRMLQALTYQAQGAFDQARDALAHALALALPAGYVRLFVDEGTPLRSLLARVRAQQPKGDVLRRYLDMLLAAFAPVPTVLAADPPQDGGIPMVEPLSEREREVLQLLAAGRTNQEIARQLVVAVSTVKTHVHHVFAKLQAADRLQAVTRARELGLIER
jgi:LuxR family maltose regulon positive regulatory protein